MSLIGLKNEASASGFIETIGTSTAVGLALGASTLPFYDQPSEHLGTNLAIGAALGAVVGLGIYGVERMNRPSDYEKFISQSSNAFSRPLRRVGFDPGLRQNLSIRTDRIMSPIVSFFF